MAQTKVTPALALASTGSPRPTPWAAPHLQVLALRQDAPDLRVEVGPLGVVRPRPLRQQEGGRTWGMASGIM